jgi:hypothetical protein
MSGSRLLPKAANDPGATTRHYAEELRAMQQRGPLDDGERALDDYCTLEERLTQALATTVSFDTAGVLCKLDALVRRLANGADGDGELTEAETLTLHLAMGATLDLRSL